MPIVFAIVASEVVHTGVISYKFMFDSQAPWEEIQPFSSHFGVLTLAEKDPDYVEPFRLVRGQPGAIGPDGTLRWNLVLMRAGSGPVFTLGCDATAESFESMLEEMRKVPDCVLLMNEDTFPHFQPLCTAAGIDLRSHRFNGVLRTS